MAAHSFECDKIVANWTLDVVKQLNSEHVCYILNNMFKALNVVVSLDK